MREIAGKQIIDDKREAVMPKLSDEDRACGRVFSDSSENARIWERGKSLWISQW